MKSGAGPFHSGRRSLHKEYLFYSDTWILPGMSALTHIISITMGIPKGSTPEDNKARRLIIKEFYSCWMLEHPERKVWNKSLNAFINVKYSFINEALGHAPRSVETTSAQLHLTEILSDAEYIESRPPKYGDKNQKKFSKMLLLKWKSSRVLVGQRKTSRDLELY